MNSNLVYLYLLSPLHTGGITQEGNLLGIARESHTNLPYIPSSTIRGKLRASVGNEMSNRIKQVKLFGPDLKTDIQDRDFVAEYEIATGKKLTQLEQGDVWIGDGSVLWLPVPSLSHGVVWISSPMLLQRWARLNRITVDIPQEYSTNLNTNQPVYLKDAILKAQDLHPGDNWETFVPQIGHANIRRLLVLPDQHCCTLIQMSLWRQVKIKLDEYKSVDGGFRYEEAIPPDTLMYFPWGITSQVNGSANQSHADFQTLMTQHSILQIGGQESLGRGFVQQFIV
ncbi:type III-B CRISPR module RAMP protein Cmr4 [Gloeocapsopsis dulcis]|uniref:Type III-B CRISPR module RAMP protein Cmr4 n=1 Tax=Gloeocapsopsis dulcis AAB1 = 1H9 TaxID=1433147 RepID=A0A6N8FYH0_9CHRO|nr:type III-B CRISPR module RAMP protein Cmr4 [Gloeocapsopsis dulcis]MUL38190.1 type III-B CRISPR module RAMP protein Cmr4 [Gloeocapsopsis dulcis AAB1 = 1H9]WNN90778.1 type III-B CRISPR module RAMP protein Cmr4 [Gloeocapsopsis dulcis]